MAKKTNLDGAIAMLVVHAENCEHNSVIAGDEGRWEEKVFNDSKALEYREAIKVLKAAAK